MKQCKTKILSVLLVLVMVLGIIPVASMTASADDGYNYTADSWYALDMYLKAAGTCTIKLTDNIKLEYEPETEGHETLNIYGNKTIDLNGYKIECTDSNSIKYDEGKEVSVESEKTLFNIYKGSTLTINDSKGGGEIAFKGEHVKESEHYFHYAKRDVFSVDGTLVVNAGKITAGSQGKEYIYKGEEIESIWGSLYSDWSGNAQQVTWGTAAHVNNGGKLIVNGGELSGRGIHVYQDTNTNKAVMGQRDEVVYIAEGGTVSVNGGSFTALEGANVFAGDGVADGLKVRIGKFELKKPSTIRVIYDKELYAEHFKYWGLAELVSYATVGSFNIPEEAYKDVYNILSVKYEGKEYKGFSEISALTFEKENYRDTLSLRFAPLNDSSVYDAKLKLVYGTNVYDNAQTQYEYNAETAGALKLYCEFDKPYFVDCNSEILYVWSVWVDDNEGKADYEFFTEENFINPVKLSQADLTGKTVFVSCDAYEVGPNASAANHYTNTFKLSPADKPLGYLEITEEQPIMPEGKDTAYIESYTESWDGYNFNHKPLPQELIDAGYYVERVYSLVGLNGTEIPETTNTDTNLIEFGMMYSAPGVYTLRMGLRLKDKDGNVVDSLGHVFYIFVNNCYEITELSANVEPPVDGELPKNTTSRIDNCVLVHTDWSKKSENGEYYLMKDGETFKNGESYECIVEYKIADPESGYYFAETPDCTINGEKAKLFNHDEDSVAFGIYFTCKEPLEVIFTSDSKPYIGEKLTVDIEAMAQQDESLMEAYFNEEVTYQWYTNGSKLADFTDVTLELEDRFANREVCVEVTFGDITIRSKAFEISYATPDESKPTEPSEPTEPTTPDEPKPSDPIEPTTPDETEPSEPLVDKGILGDVNGDGKVNIKDATMIQKFAAKLMELTDAEFIRADVNADAKVNIKDATAIQKFVAKMETGLAIGKPIA